MSLWSKVYNYSRSPVVYLYLMTRYVLICMLPPNAGASSEMLISPLQMTPICQCYFGICRAFAVDASSASLPWHLETHFLRLCVNIVEPNATSVQSISVTEIGVYVHWTENSIETRVLNQWESNQPSTWESRSWWAHSTCTLGGLSMVENG